MSEKGASFVDNQAYFKKNTSHSGTFVPRSEQINHTGKTVSQTGRNTAQSSKTIAITSSNPSNTGRTQRIPSGAIPPVHSQKLPKATNTVAIDDEKIVKELKESKWLTVILGIILALLIVIAVSFIIWFSMVSGERELPENTKQINTETEIEWNTEHTEKF